MVPPSQQSHGSRGAMSVGTSLFRATSLLSPTPHDGFRLWGRIHAASRADPRCGGGQSGTSCRRPPRFLSPATRGTDTPVATIRRSFFFLPPPSPPTDAALPTARPRPCLFRTVCGVAPPPPRWARPPPVRQGSPPLLAPAGGSLSSTAVRCPPLRRPCASREATPPPPPLRHPLDSRRRRRLSRLVR